MPQVDEIRCRCRRRQFRCAAIVLVAFCFLAHRACLHRRAANTPAELHGAQAAGDEAAATWGAVIQARLNRTLAAPPPPPHGLAGGTPKASRLPPPPAAAAVGVTDRSGCLAGSNGITGFETAEHVVFMTKKSDGGGGTERGAIEAAAAASWCGLAGIAFLVISSSDVPRGAHTHNPTIGGLYDRAMALRPGASTYTYVNSDCLSNGRSIKPQPTSPPPRAPSAHSSAPAMSWPPCSFLTTCKALVNRGGEFFGVGRRTNVNFTDYTGSSFGQGSGRPAADTEEKAPPSQPVRSRPMSFDGHIAGGTCRDCTDAMPPQDADSFDALQRGGELYTTNALDFFIASPGIWNWSTDIPPLVVGRVTPLRSIKPSIFVVACVQDFVLCSRSVHLLACSPPLLFASSCRLALTIGSRTMRITRKR